MEEWIDGCDALDECNECNECDVWHTMQVLGHGQVSTRYCGALKAGGGPWGSQVQIETTEPWFEPSMVCLELRGKTPWFFKGWDEEPTRPRKIVGVILPETNLGFWDGESLDLGYRIFGGL